MSRTVARLEQLGLVERRPNPVDGRGFVIAISEDGSKALRQERAARGRWLARAIAAQLDPAEQQLVALIPELLDKLSDFQPEETAANDDPTDRH